MKNKEQHNRHGKSFLLSLILIAVICLSQPALSKVEILGSGVIGLTHAKESGPNRALIFFAHGETDGTMNLTSVTYGGQAMTKVIDRNYRATIDAYVAAFMLDEAGVAAATSGTFSLTWSATPSEVKYSSVFLSNVNQTTSIGATGTGGSTSNPVTTSSLATSDGDMVIDAATCGNSGTYTLNNGFTQIIHESSGSSTGVTGYKSATGSNETPSVQHSAVNRHVIIGFVVQGAVSDPNKASNPSPAKGTANVAITTNLSWTAGAGATSHDVYFGTDPVARNNPKTTVYTNTFNPSGNLEYGTTYYWVVDANASGVITAGDDWNFTTIKLYDRVAGNMILINDNGGWCWYQDEKIAYDPVGGNILINTAAQATGFGGISADRHNDMDFTQFNIATGKRTRVVAKEGFGGDDHNMGAFWIRPDGRYLHVYSQHYNDPQLTYLRLSTNPYDGSLWGSEYTYNWETISGLTDTHSSSYTNVAYLSGEGTGMGRLYNIIRVFTRTPCISYSDDWGATWNYMGRLNGITGSTTYSNFYHKFAGNGVDRIDFIGCEQHPRNYNNSIYHGYIKNGKSYNSYGVEMDTLNDQTAPSIQAFTPIFITDQNQTADSYHTGWTNELELDAHGYPVCLYQTRYGTEAWGNGSGQNNIGAADHRFFYARFDGTSWTSTELAKMGVGLHLPEQDYIGMGCIHPDDVNIVYISTQFDPRDDTENEYREIFKGVTNDNGLTWDWTQITFNSTQNNTRPAIPKWDANNTAVVWTRGNWIQENAERYDLTVMGIVEEHNKTIGLTTYFDANISNTTNADGSPFSPTGPSSGAGSVDNRWHEYTGYGNGGSCYTAGDGGTENVPAIRTRITGLADGTYDVFTYFWADPTQDWGIRAGFETSDLLCISRQSSQFAEASGFSNSVETMGNPVLLYRAYIGRKTVTAGSAIDVYLDNYDSAYNSNAPTRTTYDGIGTAKVIPIIPGDIYRDGKVDLYDIAELGQGWLTIYNIETLSDIAENWLVGTDN